MKWFKHASVASDDELMSELMDKFGAEGYGVYWIICERIARFMDDSERCSATYSLKKWSEFSRVSVKKFQNLVEFLKNRNRFILNNDDGLLSISYPNLLKYKDEYTRKCKQKENKTPDNIPPVSGQSDHQNKNKKENKNIYTTILPARVDEEVIGEVGKYQNFFLQRLQCQFHIVKKPEVVLMLAEWVKEKIPIETIELAANYADAKLGRKPDTPMYYKNYVTAAHKAELDTSSSPPKKKFERYLTLAERNAKVAENWLKNPGGLDYV